MIYNDKLHIVECPVCVSKSDTTFTDLKVPITYGLTLTCSHCNSKLSIERKTYQQYEILFDS